MQNNIALVGRLGNQMFCGAFAYSLYKKYGQNFTLYWENRHKNNMNSFIHDHYEYVFHKLYDKISFTLDTKQNTINDYTLKNFSSPSNYCGYFQSTKLFSSRQDILELYEKSNTVKIHIESKYRDLLEKYSDACFVNVRRGDYLKLQNIFSNLYDEGYYAKAFNEFDNNQTFIVSSDDVDWCKTVFTGYNFMFIENELPPIALYLGTYFKKFIGANSTFSWWIAYLNTNKNTKIIMPKHWMVNETENTRWFNELFYGIENYTFV